MVGSAQSSWPARECDCLAHRFGNAAGHPGRRNTEPTAAVIDSQSVKADATVKNDSRGFDGGKKINGRKRHLVVDCLGLLPAAAVTPASTTDRDAATAILPALRNRFRTLRLIWADSGYTGHLVDWAANTLGLTLEIVKRTDNLHGFHVLPRRWVVERTNAWLMRSRRLARDDETHTASAQAMILWSMTTLMSRRLALPHHHYPVIRRTCRRRPARIRCWPGSIRRSAPSCWRCPATWCGPPHGSPRPTSASRRCWGCRSSPWSPGWSRPMSPSRQLCTGRPACSSNGPQDAPSPGSTTRSPTPTAPGPRPTTPPAPSTFLHRVDHRHGLTTADFAALDAWLQAE